MTPRRLSHFDFFHKIESTYKNQTEKGGLLSIVVICILASLFLAELFEYLKLKHDQEFLVDPSIQGKLELNLDITVAMRCQYLVFYLHDSVGTLMDLSQSFKLTDTSLSAVGMDLSKNSPFKDNYEDNGNDFDLGKVIKDAKKSHSDGWSLMKLLGSASNIFDTSSGACRIQGSAILNKVAGKFIVNIYGHGNFGPHVDHSYINLTHIITKLQFGPYYPGLRNPLDGLAKVAPLTFETFSYYLSVVPTIYVDRRHNVLLTNQYAVTEHERKYEFEDLSAVRSTPGITFHYDMEPISVRVTETSTSFITFLLRVFAIMGGIWYMTDFLYVLAIK